MTSVPDSTETGTLPAEAVEGILEATAATLRTICGKKPDLASSAAAPEDSGLCAAIGFKGDLCFEIAFGVPRDTAKALATSFAGVPIDFDCEVMPDLIGEVTNVIAGAVGAKLSLAGFTTDISLPEIAPTLEPLAGDTVVRLTRMDAGFGPMWLAIRAERDPT